MDEAPGARSPKRRGRQRRESSSADLELEKRGSYLLGPVTSQALLRPQAPSEANTT